MKEKESRKPINTNFGLKFNVEAILKRGGKVIARFVKHNVSPTVGKRHIADQLAETPAQNPMSHMATGTGADAGADPTALTTELSRVALTGRDVQSGEDANKVLYECTWAAGVGTGTVTEAIIVNAAADGVILAYVHWDAAIPKVADVELTLKWTASIT